MWIFSLFFGGNRVRTFFCSVAAAAAVDAAAATAAADAGAVVVLADRLSA